MPKDIAFTKAGPVGLVAGANLRTPCGARRVENIRVGDLVVTRDAGLQPVRVVFSRTVTAGELAAATTQTRIASATGVSRAVLAKRFTEMLDEPPMTFLTNWRIDLAADLLRQPDLTLGAVAQQVGYSTPFALSSAFKRVRGVSPQAHRENVAS